jgi:hypothetical protein
MSTGYATVALPDKILHGTNAFTAEGWVTFVRCLLKS